MALRRYILLVGTSLLLAVPFQVSHSQATPIRELTTVEGTVPVRIMGYGIVVGLDGTGDRGLSGRTGDQTVQSVSNLLRRFGIEVPASALRTRNAAAVLVTAEISPYLRSGGRFDVTVSSLGDARSLRGGTLWMTPLVTSPNTSPLASAQGNLIMSDGRTRDSYPIETSGKIPSGGILEEALPPTNFAGSSRLLLKEPNIITAARIAESINREISANVATVEDPGSVLLTFPEETDRNSMLVRIQELTVSPQIPNRIIIDSKDGSVAAGGDITVGSATVSHSGITLTIGASNTDPSDGPQPVRLQPGVTAQQVASALHAVQLEAQEIAAIFIALKDVGAVSAQIIVK